MFLQWSCLFFANVVNNKSAISVNTITYVPTQNRDIARIICCSDRWNVNVAQQMRVIPRNRKALNCTSSWLNLQFADQAFKTESCYMIVSRM